MPIIWVYGNHDGICKFIPAKKQKTKKNKQSFGNLIKLSVIVCCKIGIISKNEKINKNRSPCPRLSYDALNLPHHDRSQYSLFELHYAISS